jgi:hypothetical protein
MYCAQLHTNGYDYGGKKISPYAVVDGVDNGLTITNTDKPPTYEEAVRDRR